MLKADWLEKSGKQPAFPSLMGRTPASGKQEASGCTRQHEIRRDVFAGNLLRSYFLTHLNKLQSGLRLPSPPEHTQNQNGDTAKTPNVLGLAIAAGTKRRFRQHQATEHSGPAA